MAAATSDFARIAAGLDPVKIDPEKANHLASIGLKIHGGMSSRMGAYYTDKKISIPPEMVNAARSSREGDHSDDVLEHYSNFFATYDLKDAPSIVDDVKDLLAWFGGLSRVQLVSIFNNFRDIPKKLTDIPSQIWLLHKLHCDTFEIYFGSNVRGEGTDFATGLDCLDVLHFCTKTSNSVMRGHPPPPRPLQLITMLLGNLVAVQPLYKLLINLQHCKDARQKCFPPDGVTVYPDQAVLCDFLVWSHSFFTYINRLFLKSKDTPYEPPMPPVETSNVFAADLEALMRKSVVPLGAPRRDARGTLIVHEQPIWLTVPSNKTGLKFRPWVVDLVIVSNTESQPIRLGKLPYFTSRPDWTGQLVALFEYCDKHKFVDSGALLNSISFSSPSDTLAAHAMLSVPPLSMGCNTNEQIDHVLSRQKVNENAFSLSRAATSSAKIDRSEHTEIHWQLHAEPLTAKGGKITLEYLNFWYKQAANFFRSKPWAKCSNQIVLEVFANGVGRRNVVISGSDGTPTALRLFKSSQLPDLTQNHDACIFTSQSNCAFADLKAIEDFQLEVANEFGYPSLFSGYDIFKRPPFAELEMYRVCFELFTTFFDKQSFDIDVMEDQTKWKATSVDISVLGEAHPIRVEVIIPASKLREEPSLIEVVKVENESLVATATQNLCDTYDAALAVFKTKGAFHASSLDAAEKAVTLNMKVAAFMLAHRRMPQYKTWSKEPTSPSQTVDQILKHQAIAYCVRSAEAWRGCPGALTWLEQQAHIRYPLPPRIVKCGFGVCNNAGSQSEFKRCSACKSIFYCCANCQKKDWPIHKTNCKKLKEQLTTN